MYPIRPAKIAIASIILPSEALSDIRPRIVLMIIPDMELRETNRPICDALAFKFWDKNIERKGFTSAEADEQINNNTDNLIKLSAANVALKSFKNILIFTPFV